MLSACSLLCSFDQQGACSISETPELVRVGYESNRFKHVHSQFSWNIFRSSWTSCLKLWWLAHVWGAGTDGLHAEYHQRATVVLQDVGLQVKHYYHSWKSQTSAPRMCQWHTCTLHFIAVVCSQPQDTCFTSAPRTNKHERITQLLLCLSTGTKRRLDVLPLL